MKKSLLTLALGVMAFTAGAQVVEVQSVTKVPLPQDLLVNIPRISPDGTFAIVSTLADNTLQRVDLTTGTYVKVADNGSALHVAFSPDSRAMVYRSSSTDASHRRLYAVKSVDLTTNVTSILAAPARHSADFSVSPAGVLTVTYGGRVKSSAMNGGASNASLAHPTVGINRGHMEVTMPDGRSSFLDPQGRGSYLWPSLSPDGTKIVYYLSMHGCFVCNLDGSDVRPLGYIHAPRWMGNDIIVGCRDYDNGTFITESSIVAARLDGTTQTLTGSDVIALNPSADASAGKIAFSTPDGQLYVINLK